MFKKSITLIALLASVFLSGCASVPMDSADTDKAKKEFSPGVAPLVSSWAIYLPNLFYLAPL